ncbi:DUF427 domain-containing protein [Dyella halodurans]|uniref:DUF427 domain-containing protein n=1 Tax=Dyella halodurans TaxID=1920171 RepID=A0ABV9C2B3_9GAMM|nr:DUF427 domain-containing protein [Dyella halodurans]
MNQQAQPAVRSVKVPSPEHPIEIEANPQRVVVTFGGQIIADSRNALTLREASYPPVHYIPRRDVNMSLLARSEHSTYCPYKGDCSYFGISVGDQQGKDAVWTYEAPFPAVAEIKDHLAFYSDRVDSIDEMA